MRRNELYTPYDGVGKLRVAIHDLDAPTAFPFEVATGERGISDHLLVLLPSWADSYQRQPS